MKIVAAAVFLCAGLVFASVSPSQADAGAGDCQAKTTALPFEVGSTCCTQAKPVGKDGKASEVLYQNPWAAAIDYKEIKTGAIKRLCAGTLVGARYVLTASHCLVGVVLKSYEPIAVRLGAYDLNNKGKDCIAVEGGEDCNNGAVSIPIEKTIPHPGFAHPDNDIGLIRLKEAAPYTDFIRPICLPTKNVEDNPPDHSLHAVSWRNQNVKTLYEVPFVSKDKCKSFYGTRKVELKAGHICAGGLEGQDTCRGDGGGALVDQTQEGSSVLVGIVSFGAVPCGQKDVPSVYTNIYQYLDWIKSNIVA